MVKITQFAFNSEPQATVASESIALPRGPSKQLHSQQFPSILEARSCSHCSQRSARRGREGAGGDAALSLESFASLPPAPPVSGIGCLSDVARWRLAGHRVVLSYRFTVRLPGVPPLKVGANCATSLCGEGSPREVWLDVPNAPPLRPSVPRSRQEGGRGRRVRGRSGCPRSWPRAARAPRPLQACRSSRGRQRRPLALPIGAGEPGTLPPRLPAVRPPRTSGRP